MFPLNEKRDKQNSDVDFEYNNSKDSINLSINNLIASVNSHPINLRLNVRNNLSLLTKTA